jgi:hypothetical protein
MVLIADIADSTKVRLASFFFLICLWPNPSIFFSKKMDDALTHFDAAHYRLCVLLCTFWSCNKYRICYRTRMCISITGLECA